MTDAVAHDLMANAIRAFSMDAVEQAKSGGTPACRWAGPMSRRCSSRPFSNTTPPIRIGPIANDDLVGWGWNPGEGREPAPGTQAIFGELIRYRVETGAACPAV